MDDSPLNKLSPEIRNYIAELAMTRPAAIKISGTGKPYKEYQPALTQTCKQLRNETLGLFYSCNSFSLVLNQLDPRPDCISIEHYLSDALVPLSVFIDVLRKSNITSLGSFTMMLSNIRRISRGFGYPTQELVIQLVQEGLRKMQHLRGSRYVCLKVPYIHMSSALQSVEVSIKSSSVKASIEEAVDTLVRIGVRKEDPRIRNSLYKRIIRELEGWKNQLV